MAKYIKLPDNSLFPVAEGEDYSAAMRAAYSKYPEAFGDAPVQTDQPKSGFTPALKAGFSGLKSGIAALAGRTGIVDEAAAEQYMKEQEAYQAKTFKPTETFGEAPVTKALELLGGSIPYMAAPVVAGGVAASAPVAGALGLGAAGATALGLGATGLASGAQFTGSNLQRQMGEDKTLAETDLGSAALAAIPQAALDVVGLKMIPGIRGILAAGGKQVSETAAKKIAEQGIKDIAKDYAATTGKAMSAEGLTEAAQQVLERAQAGLKLTDPAAREEYFDSFIGGAVLGGAIAPVGRRLERGAQQGRQEQAAAEEERKNAAQAAAEAEAAKTTPEALRKLDIDYRAATQQKKAFDEQIKAATPKKGATAEEKSAFQQLKDARAALVETQLRPLSQEYNKRKAAIASLEDTRQADLEAQTADQPTATVAIAEGEAPQTDVQRLMLEQDGLRTQMQTLEAELEQAPPEQFDALNAQRQELQRRVDARATLIEEAGGSPLAQAEFEQATAAKMQGIDTRMDKLASAYTTALASKDYDAAAKAKDDLLALRKEREAFTNKTAQQMQALQEKQTGLAQRGQTRELDLDTPAQPEQEGLTFTAPTIDTAPVDEEIKPTQVEMLVSSQQKIADAQTELDAAIEAKTAQTPEELYPLLDKLNQAQDEASRAIEDVGRPTLKPVILDIFSPANLFNTAYANGDANLINALARQTDKTTLRTTLDEKATEREKLTRLLDTRLDLGGAEKSSTGEPLKSVKRERVDLFSQQYEPKQQALFKNGTYPDKALQDLYDKGGPAAVEYENVMQRIEALSKQVTTKQGNAKKSLYEQLVDLAAEHAELTAQMEAGVAVPTKGEKVAALQAKMGKGDTPATRQMDAAEKYQLQRRIAAVENRYKLVEGRVAPIREQVIKAYDSLYTTKPLEKASVVAERRADNAERAAKEPKKITREAKTIARINKGDVRKEAEASQKMRDLARDLGAVEPEYQQFSDGMTKRYADLKKKYGNNDPAVVAFQADMAEQLNDKAASLGKQTPEYKATLKEQIAYFQEVLPTAGKQTAATQRSTQVTRKQNAAPGRLVTSSPESRKQSEAEGVREKRRMFRDFQEGVGSEADSDYGDALFRTSSPGAKGVSLDSLKSLVTKMTANWKNAPDIVSVANFDALPENIKTQARADGVQDIIPGVYDPNTKKVYLVAAHITGPADAVATVAHEAAGHFGLREMLGTTMGSEMDRLYAGNSDIRAKADAKLKQSPNLPKQVAVEEVLAEMAEADPNAKAAGVLRRVYNVVKALLKRLTGQTVSDADVQQVVANARRFVMDGPAAGAKRESAAAPTQDKALYRGASKRGEFDAEQEPSTVSKIVGNITGLAGRMQLVDKYAAVSEAFKKGMNKGVLTDTEAGNAEYLLRFSEHRSQLAGQVLTNGPLSLVTTKTDKGVEHTYQSTSGANAVQMAEALNKGGFANDAEAEGMFTLYLAGARAKQVGWDKLNYSNPDAEKAKYQRLMDALNAAPKKKAAIEAAAKIYKQFNDGLMDFLVQTGEITAAKAAELKAITYVPFYRVNNNGEVQLMIDKERPLRIGNIKDEPQLQQLVGDNKQIMPVFASMVQNTFMLTNLGLRNQSVKETAFMLRKLGIASRIGTGPGPAGADTVRFKKNGVDMHVVIDTDMYGIPAKYIVEGMEGIKTTIPAVIKLMGIPADILRQFVTRSPTYALRQMIRDPLNAWLTTGTDATPVLGSFKELASMVAGRNETEKTLMSSGAVSSNVFTGDERDMDKVLREITSGKAGWTKLMAKADAFALQGDTATRATIYKDSIAKGMSHQQALLRSVESMNFSRRGLSPSIQMLSTMIPFFNAQIQGLDVLYRAFTGNMTYNEQLKIREKLFQRGLLLAAGTMAYAVAMQDDEAYKRAKPEERYGNWFVYIPGVSEPLRVPIPFELGYLFKSLPEALVNMAYGDAKASDALGGVGKLLAQSNPLALPQAVKPLTEVILGKSFFSGDIESDREVKSLLATERYRDSTSEVSKLLGSVTGNAGLSPIKIDYLIRGYTGGLGLALVQLANPLLNTEAEADVAKPSMKPSKIPFVGGLFQPVEGRGTLDSAYSKMVEIQQAKGTYNKLIESGKRAEAMAFAQDYANELALASTSGSVQQALGKMAAQERAIKASTNLTTEQKDEALARLDNLKVAYARQFLSLADKTKPQ